MNILLQGVKIIHPQSPLNGKQTDVLIQDGVIQQIADKIAVPEGAQVINSQQLVLTPGLFDMLANFRDPGLEHQEDISTGCAAAAQGGFTGVAVMPSTQPPVDNKSQVEYVLNKAKTHLVDVFPIGTISQHHEGKELSEMYDMHLSGAVGFSDDKIPVSNTALMQKAMLYAKNFGGLVMSFPEDKNLTSKGMMNEGVSSTHLGMKGMPALAEEIHIQRDIQLMEYTESALHFTMVSTAGAVKLIREAKAKGLPVTAAVAVHNLVLDDSSLFDFDTNYKVKHPLRTKADIDALTAALLDGTIDAICTDHSPEDVENKHREFEYAAFGMLGLETAFALLNTHLGKALGLEKLITLLAINPRKILGISVPAIAVGETANLTLLNPTQDWTFATEHLQSRSCNTPFIGHALKGKTIAVFNKKQVVFAR